MGNPSVASPVSVAGIAYPKVRASDAGQLGPRTCINLDKQGIGRWMRLREIGVGVWGEQECISEAHLD